MSERQMSYQVANMTTLILLAWEAGELSEGDVAAAIGLDRIDVREMKSAAIQSAVSLAKRLRQDCRSLADEY